MGRNGPLEQLIERKTQRIMKDIFDHSKIPLCIQINSSTMKTYVSLLKFSKMTLGPLLSRFTLYDKSLSIAKVFDKNKIMKVNDPRSFLCYLISSSKYGQKNSSLNGDSIHMQCSTI